MRRQNQPLCGLDSQQVARPCGGHYVPIEG
jgi:hypothetical protein